METPRAVTPRDSVLSDAELAQIWEIAGRAVKLIGPIVRLLIATGQRRKEITGLEIGLAIGAGTALGGRSDHMSING